MTQPLSGGPVVVEPVVNREKLHELLALQTEYRDLDFKSGLDIGDKQTRARAELAKDVGAMSIRGGFLIIGVDGRGKPTGQLTAAQAALFDEARLRPLLLKWLPDSLEILTQDHEIDGHRVVLLYVAPNPAGCAFFRADGQYRESDKQPPKVVFRGGDVFCREGTSSVRLTQAGFEQLIQQRVARERQQWEAQNAQIQRHLAEALHAGIAGQRTTQGAAAEFNLSHEPEVLIDAAVELLRAQDDIPLRRLLSSALSDVRAAFQAEDEDTVTDVLDRLTCLAATFLDLERREWFTLVVEALARIYNVGFEGIPPIINTPPRASAALWLAIIERVMALGSLAVRRDDWQAVRTLTVQRPPGMNEIYTSWLGNATTMISRAELLTQQHEGRAVVESLLSRARAVVRRWECLHPDVAADDEAVLTGLTQFDFLASLLLLAHSNNDRGLYPNFARFAGERTRPAAQHLLTDPVMRKTLYPGDDQHLARALHAIDETARKEGFRYDGWEGYTPDVNAFIRDHGGGAK